MSYYISRLPNGTAKIQTSPPHDSSYIEVDSLPDGPGILMVSKNGRLYREFMPIIPAAPLGPTADDKIKALSDYQDFLEECIVEMAQEVYK